MTPRFTRASGWAGTDAGRRTALALLLLAAVAPPVAAQSSVERNAELRIELPAGADRRVEVWPGPDRVELNLPEGAGIPQDFAAASNGLLRSGEVQRQDGRLAVELEMASGFLERVIYEPDAVVLRFRSRFAPDAGGANEQDRYELGADDKIRLTIHNRPELSTSLVVGRDGSITAPLVGDVQAQGLTARQLAARLTERLDRTYLVDPEVDVEVEEYLSQWVIVGGEVLRPGRVALRGGTRLKEVIGDTQGFTEYAGDEIVISRKIEGRDEAAELTVRREDFEAGRSNPPLSDGDLIEVPRAASCYIQGEVRSGGPFRVERGMTLLRAIALAGGLTDWANRKAVIVRHLDGTQETYNLNRIQNGKEPDPPMRGGEVIIVKKRFL